MGGESEVCYTTNGRWQVFCSAGRVTERAQPKLERTSRVVCYLHLDPCPPGAAHARDKMSEDLPRELQGECWLPSREPVLGRALVRPCRRRLPPRASDVIGSSACTDSTQRSIFEEALLSSH